jgi:hypothetical protein
MARVLAILLLATTLFAGCSPATVPDHIIGVDPPDYQGLLKEARRFSACPDVTLDFMVTSERARFSGCDGEWEVFRNTRISPSHAPHHRFVASPAHPFAEDASCTLDQVESIKTVGAESFLVEGCHQQLVYLLWCDDRDCRWEKDLLAAYFTGYDDVATEWASPWEGGYFEYPEYHTFEEVSPSPPTPLQPTPAQLATLQGCEVSFPTDGEPFLFSILLHFFSDGTVDLAERTDPYTDHAFTDCVLDQVEDWHFPPPPSGSGSIVISFPLEP